MKHVKTIDDFDDLVDLQTLTCHYLGPEPSTFVLWAIAIEEKSEYYCVLPSSFFPFLFFFFFKVFSFFSLVEMTTKFN